MMKLFCKVVLLAYCLITSVLSASEMLICVDNHENTCQHCDKTVTLEDMPESLNNVSSSVTKNVTLCLREVMLQNDIVIKDISFIWIGTNFELSTIKCTSKDFGIKLENVTNLSIQNIAVENCGGLYNSTSQNTSNPSTNLIFKTSIFLLKCTNVAISEVCVTKNNGIGLTLIDCGGSVTIVNSTFSENLIDTKSSVNGQAEITIPGGGGLYIEFSNCTPGDITPKNICEYNGVSVENSTYIIERCSFENNTAHSVKENMTSYVRASESNFQGLGRGGGLCIHFRGSSMKNEINILNCSFIHNQAIWGGGLYISVHNSPDSNQVYIDHGRFIRNNCTLNGGGGIDVGFLFYNYSQSRRNKLRFNNSEFIENQAEYGGGALIYSSSAVNFTNLENEIGFENCSWVKNRAIFGAAVNLGTHTWDTLKRGFLPTPVFKDCTFQLNSVDKSLHQESIEGKGTFVVVGMDLSFQGVTKFIQNNNTALYLVSSTAIFPEHSDVLFEGNKGKSGGAMVILSLGSLEISDNSVFRFINNSAREKGGAIYQISRNVNDFIVSRSCFIQYSGSTKNLSERNINFTFEGNRAGNNADIYDGNSIYVGTLKPCYTGCLQKNLTTYNETFDCIGNFHFEKNIDFEISTVGVRRGNLTPHDEFISIIPGKNVEVVPVTLRNELGYAVNALYHLFLRDNENTSIAISEHYISDKWVQVYGNPGERATLWVETVDVWEVSFSLNITMQECPPGFSLTSDIAVMGNNVARCRCMANSPKPLYNGIFDCDEEFYVSTMNIGYWYGYKNTETEGRENDLISGYCPLHYCVYYKNRSLILPNSTNQTKLDLLLCGNRTGRLCGKCRGNQSVSFHLNGYECTSSEKCHLGILLYLVTEILPITIFFIAVVFLDINFTHGAINGLIFFFQVTDVSIHLTSGFVRCDPTISGWQDVYNLLTGIFNLKFFYHPKLSFCLFRGFHTLDVLAFRYITVVYSLFLVVAIISIMKAYNLKKITGGFPKFCGKKVDMKLTVIHGISGFLVLCYSECSKLSLLILTPVILYNYRNGTETVVLGNGNLGYFKSGHLKYAFPALFFLILVGLIPPLLLFSYPLCYKIFGLLKVGESKFVHLLCMIIPLEKFRPFFDSFQSSFKDKYRFYSGLYFIYRFITLMTFSITHSYTDYFTAILIIYSVILCLHAVIQPYKEKWHNVLDGLIFTNLIIYHALTLYSYRRTLNNKSINIICVFQTILLYIPVVYILIKLIKITVQTFRKMNFGRKVMSDNNLREQELSESLLFTNRDSIQEL